MNTEKGILSQAIQNLAENAHIKAKWKQSEERGADVILHIDVEGRDHEFFAEVKNELRAHHLDHLIEMSEEHEPFMIVANKLFPSVKERLREKNIAYLESNGSIWFQNKNSLVWIETNKKVKEIKEEPNRAFTQTGLILIFHLFIQPDLINSTLRNISEVTNISLGNVSYILKGLKEAGYLIEIGNARQKLTNKMELLEKWRILYGERLRPKLHLGNFYFLKDEDAKRWDAIALKENQTFWGGEPAADIITNHLIPQTFTLYTLENKGELMKNYRVVPKEGGNISVYKKFWRENSNQMNVVPPLLIYADLMNSGTERNIEVAKRIWDEFIENKF